MTKKVDKISELIEKSGSNDLQMRVAHFLEQKGWKVSYSPYYNDPVTGKSREIDLIVTRDWHIGFVNERYQKYYVRLFIECKHIKEPVVFYMRDKNIPAAREVVKQQSFLHQYGDGILNGTRLHTLDNCKVAKGTAKAGRDDIYDALNQSLNGLIFFENVDVPGSYHLDLPLIVVDSFENLYERDETEKGYSSVAAPIQFEMDYSYKEPRRDGNPIDRTRYFLIDVTSEELLEALLEDIEKRDIDFMVGCLSRQLAQQAINAQRRSEDRWRDSTM